ncbi:hypothetical protein MGA3_15051 [Bacillus methanolicus MGA3]|uniref:Uncharacterized protein n=1 Tax=Bacillus methanolicus (strain MGA3 / ATCC 53907) TaxID=796606 RepID=I3DZL3_BACMM|nr:hypothetical protein BMMGA3_06610 [Bacillus methanolicus MGA3]EIJ79684.1 hypothetical protein MGA3_15051 [Bacillus methanolicus MGA3]
MKIFRFEVGKDTGMVAIILELVRAILNKQYSHIYIFEC